MVENTKSVRFNCDISLLAELDDYCSRYVTRTQMMELAIRNYLALLQKNKVPKVRKYKNSSN